MIKASDVAKYILYFAYKRGDLITNLKLQKLLYYIQAWYLARNEGHPLFSEAIEAWQYGPVVREVYDLYKCFGRNPINDESLSDEFDLPERIIHHIEWVLDQYMDYSAATLVKNIHKDDPWIEAYSSGKEVKVISPESIYNYYKLMFLTKKDIEAAVNIPLSECEQI